MIKKTLNSIILTLCVLIAVAQSPKTFYIGHSLSDQIPDMVQSLSNDHASVDFDWVYQTIPGAPLRWQWDRKDAMDYLHNAPHFYGFYDAERGLPNGSFDVLVLTESVPRYLANIEETYAYADSFYQYATAYNPNIKVYLYEDWHCILSGTPTDCHYDVDSNPWRQRLEDDLAMWESVVDSLNTRHDPGEPVCLIPVGQGLAALYDSIQAGVIPDLQQMEDLFADDIHLTDIGKYYVACIHFAMIHGVSPIGLTNQLQVWWGGDFDSPSPALALKFQEIAWETVMNYPNSCLNITTDISEVSDSKFEVYPTLFSDQITIKSSSADFHVELFDMMGRSCLSSHSFNTALVIGTSSLSTGIYFIKITDLQRNSIEVIRVGK